MEVCHSAWFCRPDWERACQATPELAFFFAHNYGAVENAPPAGRDQRLQGLKLFRGWLTFNAVCATGALANVGVARWLFEHRSAWALSALAGIAVTTVWNYAMSSVFTWRKKG